MERDKLIKLDFEEAERFIKENRAIHSVSETSDGKILICYFEKAEK